MRRGLTGNLWRGGREKQILFEDDNKKGKSKSKSRSKSKGNCKRGDTEDAEGRGEKQMRSVSLVRPHPFAMRLRKDGAPGKESNAGSGQYTKVMAGLGDGWRVPCLVQC